MSMKLQDDRPKKRKIGDMVNWYWENHDKEVREAGLKKCQLCGRRAKA